jgi:hypothetical protein
MTTPKNPRMEDEAGIGPASAGASEICFGLDRPTDERSLCIFLKSFAAQELLEQLVPRLTDSEIQATADFLTGLLHRHLNGKEYHRLFLKDSRRREDP